MKKLKLLWLPIVMGILLLGGCAKEPIDSELEIELAQKTKTIEALVLGQKDLITEKVDLEAEVEKLQQELDQLKVAGTENPAWQFLGPSANVLSTSLEVVELLKNKDMTGLSNYVHSSGIRFTPYFYIEAQDSQVFTKQEVAALDENTEILTWGKYDGSGEPINLNFNDYYNQFIYDEDFSNPQYVGNNLTLGVGNMLDNVDEIYPNAHFIEFHFKEIEPQYEGMDWRSLRLVFEQENGLWYLVAITHGQWTI